VGIEEAGFADLGLDTYSPPRPDRIPAGIDIEQEILDA